MTSSTVEQLCRKFSLAEMQLATGDFGEGHVIGRGGFGKVYKGHIDDGSSIVAVKRLSSNSKQGQREFVAEIETLSKLRHRNLVSLIGYCNEKGEMILVYEYMPNGTLADLLHRNNHQSSSLTWNERLRICIGAARGLDYLHTGSSVIHRDVKPTNILLDKNFRAKVADFGLAKHLSGDDLESHVSASVKGTFGYFDPYYFVSGRLTKASDTYAFGVVLLEVLSGKPAIDGNLAESDLCLIMWAQEKIRNGKYHQIVASNLRAEISENCLETYVGVVKRCLVHEPKKRLSMTHVVAQLELALEQQERTGSTRKLQFRNKDVSSSGSTQRDNNEVEFNTLGEDALQSKQSVDKSEEQRYDREPYGVPAIQLSELKDNFSSKSLIACGFSKGMIFHGVLKTGQEVAVKRQLRKRDFVEQVSYLSRLKHQNVIKLLGYCVDGGVQVLVHEYAPRRSLHDILHGRKGLPLEPGPLIEIAVGAAKGLLYFHEKSLIHRNIKSSNVLVFANGTTKISDSHQSTKCHSCAQKDGVFSDCGHHPPEYAVEGYSQKGDIYNLGIVLLELLTGLKSSDLKKEISKLTATNIFDIVVATLKGDFPKKAAARMVLAAEDCVKYLAADRPSIRVVLGALQISYRETQEYILSQQFPPKLHPFKIRDLGL